MWKKVLIVVVAVVVLLVIIGLFLPKDYTVIRKTSIKAKPEAVFAQIVDFHQWDSWAAWNKRRFPDMQTQMTGEPGTLGCRWDWQGNSSGRGLMVLKEAVSPTKIVIDMSLMQGGNTFPSVNTFELVARGEHTEVVWTNAGSMGTGSIAGYLALMMEHLTGADFENGLAGLKTKLEKAG